MMAYVYRCKKHRFSQMLTIRVRQRHLYMCWGGREIKLLPKSYNCALYIHLHNCRLRN